MRVYLSGPMSGIPDDNFPAFNEAARVLREQGYEVENPTEWGEDLQHSDSQVVRAIYLREDIARLAACDGIVLLPGFSKSIGANIELAVAHALALPVFLYQDEDLLASNPGPYWALIQQHVEQMRFHALEVRP